jgi:DNA-directed RNA polymerase specialized sigma24 family protein
MVNQLYNDYNSYIKRLCKNTMIKYPDIKLEFDDLYQECMLCLCKIVNKNPNPQHRYIIKSIYNQIVNYIKKITGNKNKALTEAMSLTELFKLYK